MRLSLKKTRELLLAHTVEPTDKNKSHFSPLKGPFLSFISYPNFSIFNLLNCDKRLSHTFINYHAFFPHSHSSFPINTDSKTSWYRQWTKPKFPAVKFDPTYTSIDPTRTDTMDVWPMIDMISRPDFGKRSNVNE